MMDVVLVVAIVHAVFTLPRWVPAAWFLFGGLAAMLIADTVYARLIADGRYVDGGALDALWPMAYFLLAAAALHPSMRTLWYTSDIGLVRHGRARMIVLGAALFSAPAVVVLDDAGSSEALALTAIVGVTAALVAWRIARLVSETDRAREVLAESESRFRAFVQHSSDVVGVIDATGTITYVSPSVLVVFGYEPNSLIGHSIVELIHPDDIDRARRAIASLAAARSRANPSRFAASTPTAHGAGPRRRARIRCTSPRCAAWSGTSATSPSVGGSRPSAPGRRKSSSAS